MLANLHVKNFAIIDEIDVDFGRHLNILTGETGAGKSILVDSISIALGARVSPEMIGSHGDYAMVEIVFQIEREETLRQIRQMDIEPEDNQIVISRKITENRSINKMNGESVPVSVIRKVAELCLDIHGQHEHQSLLNREKHREIVDEYGGENCARWKEKIAGLYYQYMELKKEQEQSALSDEERARQLGFLTYEKEEIEAAALQPGEIEEVEETYRRAANAGTIAEALGKVHQLSAENAAGAISHGLRSLNEVSGLDSAIGGFSEELMQIEGLLGDFNREISEFMADFSFDEKELVELERRLDCIHTLQSKYGSTYKDIIAHLQKVNEKLEKYADYETYQKERQEKLETLQEELFRACEELSRCRKEAAGQLEERISGALEDLNFAHVDFQIQITERKEFRADGRDEVEFMIATNPGEERRSLGKIASGGELSRIMLAIKSVFADSDQIETLIFDEIDVGISGRTAQKVSEKMSLIGRQHQVICITHLAQIAAMADYHYVIEKVVEEGRSRTRIRRLSREESEEELARILGGVEITDAVRVNAREMKEMAEIMKTK
ncbi:MAG: DNA repair protein RecN [Lachnospiraceae bacterium]|nr:DNA repair protein RecN [Lachnospiraceae bacterium]